MIVLQLPQNVRLRYRNHPMRIDDVTVTLSVRTAKIHGPSEDKVAKELIRWLPMGMYEGSYLGRVKGPAD